MKTTFSILDNKTEVINFLNQCNLGFVLKSFYQIPTEIFMGEGIKGGLISESFSTLAQISKYGCQITTLNIFFLGG